MIPSYLNVPFFNKSCLDGLIQLFTRLIMMCDFFLCLFRIGSLKEVCEKPRFSLLMLHIYIQHLHIIVSLCLVTWSGNIVFKVIVRQQKSQKTTAQLQFHHLMTSHNFPFWITSEELRTSLQMNHLPH